MAKTTDWAKAFQPLLKKYTKRKHPLDYKNRYQLVVMIILAAQSSDKAINDLAPALFNTYPTFEALSKASPEDLFPYINSVRNFGNKAKWLVELARAVGAEENIPATMDTLTELPGIGRKSANVIIRESGGKAEGIVVDLHVIRVVPRLGIIQSENPATIERTLMEILPQKYWGDIGMCISFLGREICRPTNPKCEECVMNSVCDYYTSQGKGKKK